MCLRRRDYETKGYHYNRESQRNNSREIKGKEGGEMREREGRGEKGRGYERKRRGDEREKGG